MRRQRHAPGRQFGTARSRTLLLEGARCRFAEGEAFARFQSRFRWRSPNTPHEIDETQGVGWHAVAAPTKAPPEGRKQVSVDFAYRSAGHRVPPKGRTKFMVDSPDLVLAGDAHHVPKHRSVRRHNCSDYMYAALT